ncbi:hypothetical protein HKD37_03G007148 [Glycine soja]
MVDAKFDIPEASDVRTKKKILQIVGERWRQFKSDLTSKWALAADKDSVDDTQGEIGPILSDPQRPLSGGYAKKSTGHLEAKHRPPQQKLMAEKTKNKLEEVAQSESTEAMIDPPSPIRRHVKWKMIGNKKTRQMTSEEAKEIAEKIGSFVPHGRQELLTAAIRRPEHPGRVCATGVGVTINQYFGSAPRTSCTSSSMAPKELEDQLEESATDVILQPDAVPVSVTDAIIGTCTASGA